MSIFSSATETIINTLGDNAILRSADGSYYSDIKGVFGYEYIELGGVESRAPVFDCRDADLPGDPRGFLLEIINENKTFKIITPEPDGTGMINIVLERIE